MFTFPLPLLSLFSNSMLQWLKTLGYECMLNLESLQQMWLSDSDSFLMWIILIILSHDFLFLKYSINFWHTVWLKFMLGFDQEGSTVVMGLWWVNVMCGQFHCSRWKLIIIYNWIGNKFLILQPVKWKSICG